MDAMPPRTPETDGLAAQVEEAIFRAIRKVKDLGGRPLDASTAFDTLGISSLELVTVTFEMEDAFGIVIKDEYLDDFRTVGEARDTVLALLSGRD